MYSLSDIQKNYQFDGHTVVITGGAGVLGAEMVRSLVGLGANVVILCRNIEKAEKLRQDVGTEKVLILQSDVMNKEVLENNLAEVLERFGSVDSLINAAGGNDPRATTREGHSFFDIPPEALENIFQLNVSGTVLPCQVFGKGMSEQGYGSIINISSMSALVPLTRIAGYSAAKAAVSNFTQWLAVHMAQEYHPKIRVNALSPGFFLTEQNRFLLTDKETGELTARGKSIIDHTPQDRFGNPEDLLGGLLWLMSPSAQFVTGVILPIDGGFSAFSGV